ncbi:VCBS repeat-containing protein, partial [Candidatus Fermentibacteria bacterium]|nr:VCBS repeat-containing protein [Candidatus Fermentibacteria bacterium]
TAGAANVVVRAISSSPSVVVLDSVATVGSLATGQTMAVQGALVVVVAPDAYHGQQVFITLSMSADGGYGASAEIPLTLSASMPHWPRSFDAMVSAPKALDLDGDGDRELVFGDGNGLVHAVHHDGTPLAGWPVSVGAGVSAVGAPVLGDMDGDGQPEIVATAGTGVYAWRRDGTPMPGWPFAIGLSSNSLLRLSTMMEDLNNDGTQEVVVTATFGQISVLSRTGAQLASISAGDSIYCAPALADLDGDGDLEIVVACGPPTGTTGSVKAWHHNGSPMQGAWPVATEGLPQGGITAADLDGDGADEIIVPAGTLGASPNGNLYVLKGDGSNYAGWPKSLAPMIVCQPSIADLDGDGQLDIVIPVRDTPSTSQIHALRRTGASLPGWPVAVLAKVSFISPALADLDSDRKLDVVVTTETGAVHAWDRMGAPLAGFPIQVSPTFSFTGVPTLDDLDVDGDLDLVAASLEGTVHAWDLPGVYTPSMIAWAMSRHDHGNTSNIRLRGAGSGPGQTRPSALTLAWPVPNPSTGETEIKFALPAAAEVTLQICDVSGRLIYVLSSEERLEPGAHHIRWHGLNDAGLRVPSGLYLVTLEAGGLIRTRPVVLFRS